MKFAWKSEHPFHPVCQDFEILWDNRPCKSSIKESIFPAQASTSFFHFTASSREKRTRPYRGVPADAGLHLSRFDLQIYHAAVADIASPAWQPVGIIVEALHLIAPAPAQKVEAIRLPSITTGLSACPFVTCLRTRSWLAPPLRHRHIFRQ